ncbi:MAG: VanZ family protein [Clostridia bacterium]
MHFNILGHDFYFLATDLQREKAMGMLRNYIFKYEVLIIFTIVLIYIVVRCMAYFKKNKAVLNILRKLSPWVYLLVILALTVFNRDASYREIRWNFDQWITYNGFHESNVLGSLFNICLFVPLGWLLYRHSFTKHKVLKTFFTGFSAALATELLQYIFARGVTSVDDLVMNTIGALLGAVVCKLFFTIKRDRLI